MDHIMSPTVRPKKTVYQRPAWHSAKKQGLALILGKGADAVVSKSDMDTPFPKITVWGWKEVPGRIQELPLIPILGILTRTHLGRILKGLAKGGPTGKPTFRGQGLDGIVLQVTLPNQAFGMFHAKAVPIGGKAQAITTFEKIGNMVCGHFHFLGAFGKIKILV